MTRLAIFDFDDTLLRGNSWHLFFRAEFRRRPRRIPLLAAAYLLRRAGWWSGPRLRAFAVRALRGMTAAEVAAVGEAMQRNTLAARIRSGATEEITRRRAAGYRIVIATGTWDFLVAPLARQLHADAVIATPVMFADGHCLGRIPGEECLGVHKAAAIRTHFRDHHDIDWPGSCAYTDSLLDVPLLELVGERWLVTASLTVPPGFPAGTKCCRWADA